MVDYKWTFNKFNTQPSVNGLKDVVTSIDWQMDATDGVNTVTAKDVTLVPAPDTKNFLPYDKITKEWAVAMVSSATNIAERQKQLAAQLSAMATPPPVEKKPPFA